SFDEARSASLTPYGLPPLDVYVKNLPASSPLTAPVESSVCLWASLTLRNRRGVDLEGDSFNSTEVAEVTEITNTNFSHLKKLADGWGNALSFFRWPTQNQEVQALQPGSGNAQDRTFRDPLD